MPLLPSSHANAPHPPLALAEATIPQPAVPTQIEGLRLPLSASYKLSKSEIMVISHLGWSRCFQSYEDTARGNEWRTREFQRQLTQTPALAGWAAALNNSWLPKLWYARTGAFKALFIEVLAEEALALAQDRALPVIVTVPCDLDTQSSTGPRLRVAQHPSQTLLPYLQHTLSQTSSATEPNIFLLPTMPGSGAIFGTYPGFNNRHPDDESLLSFPDGSDGQHLLGPLLNSGATRVYFAGSFFDQCLRATITNFLGRTRCVAIENLVCSGEEYVFDEKLGRARLQEKEMPLPTPAHEKILERLGSLLCGKDERHVRRDIISIFRNYCHTANNWAAFEHTEQVATRRLLAKHVNDPELLRDIPVLPLLQVEIWGEADNYFPLFAR